jgi:conjugative relaxase-like TrwC/TraI family protein
MLSISKCRDLDYYEREVIDGREDYLSESGTSPGRWSGSLARADGLVGTARREDLAAVFEGRHPNGSPLSENPTRVPGFDLTLSPSKSVSLVWALGTDEDARQVVEALHAAQGEVERYLEATACQVRRGHTGERALAGAGFIGAVFLHRTSRLGDPGVHLHWTVFNTSEGPDGRRTALFGQRVYAERYTAEAVFQATLRRELACRLGLVFDEMDRHGVAEVVGVSKPTRDAFSRRRAEIRAEMDRLGFHSGAGGRVAALNTRKPKPEAVSEADLRAEWRSRATDLRFNLDAVPRVPRTPTLAVSDEELATALTEQQAWFEATNVIRETAKAARQGASLEEIRERADAFLSSPHAVPLAPGVWSTPEMLDLERGVLTAAGAFPEDFLRALPDHLTAAVEARPSLTAEQRRMVDELCSSGRPVEVVIGRAGAGKTFTLDAVREAFEASGHRVVGASLAARAARELQSGAGIPSSTAHSLQSALTAGRGRLREGDVLVVDEAGMVGTRLIADLIGRAQAARAKVVLVGDPHQLPPIEAGGILNRLAAQGPVVELIENRRQVDPEERLATTALRFGRVELAVRRLDRIGHLTTAPNSDQLRDQMVADWWQHRETGARVVMGAPRRSDVRDLNARAHDVLEAAGRVGPVVAVVDEQRFCVGDQVLALRNRYDLGVLNGDLATVTRGTDDRLVVRREDDGREVHLPLDYVTEHLQHAYARTIHKTQGLTCDVALMLGDDTLYAELGYTALTRGAQHNHLYAVVSDHADGADLAGLVRLLETSRAKTAAIDLLDPLEYP